MSFCISMSLSLHLPCLLFCLHFICLFASISLLTSFSLSLLHLIVISHPLSLYNIFVFISVCACPPLQFLCLSISAFVSVWLSISLSLLMPVFLFCLQSPHLSLLLSFSWLCFCLYFSLFLSYFPLSHSVTALMSPLQGCDKWVDLLLQSPGEFGSEWGGDTGAVHTRTLATAVSPPPHSPPPLFFSQFPLIPLPFQPNRGP